MVMLTRKVIRPSGSFVQNWPGLLRQLLAPVSSRASDSPSPASPRQRLHRAARVRAFSNWLHSTQQQPQRVSFMLLLRCGPACKSQEVQCHVGHVSANVMQHACVNRPYRSCSAAVAQAACTAQGGKKLSMLAAARQSSRHMSRLRVSTNCMYTKSDAVWMCVTLVLRHC